jgi:Clp protease
MGSDVLTGGKGSARQIMTRLVAILVTLFLVAIPAKADVELWLHPIPGWTVINVYGLIKPADVRTFEHYTENVDPDATLVTLSSRGGNLAAGIDIGMRVHLKKLIVGVIGTCASSCALIWMGGETGRKFFYQGSSPCFHQAWHLKRESDDVLPLRIPSAPGNALVSEYLTKLGYNQDMIA